ncbi:drug/metabolite transporter, putative [Plasmodium malariae]|uniref:Drug/metabolite transporter, putative n=2 Tax=Plasmodium malariae TaxID=5858 RepID=A0A1C3KA63_PLAMA|nr:drug/metabolite transporter, putative [Plasmodium malariae]SBT70417.1 drug/metabolite transporter, putative [Plasmodium malariae]SBT86278.1 drug/metabolite transporter, putative [Plasmodium malariae]
MKNEILYRTTFILFLLSYCFQPLLIDIIKYNGCGNSSTFIFLIPHYLSMIIVGFLPKKQKLTECNWMKIFFVSILDLINQVLKKVGLLYAGSAIYIIIDSCTLIFTAMWRKILLNKKISNFQLLGILLITFGIAIKSNNLKFEIDREEVIGVILIIISNFLMGLTFVLNEKYMNQMEGQNIVCLMGIFCLSFVSIWTAIWTLPNFNHLILENIKKKQGDIKTIWLSFLGLFAFNIITSSTLWYIMKISGSLTVGILKGLKVAIIFLFSHIFFCKYDSKQCLNLHSTLSVFCCIVGVLIYSFNGYLLTLTDKLYTVRKSKILV